MNPLNQVLFSFESLFGELSSEDEFRIHYVLESLRIPDSRIQSNSKYSIHLVSTRLSDSEIHSNFILLNPLDSSFTNPLDSASVNPLDSDSVIPLNSDPYESTLIHLTPNHMNPL